MLKGNVSGQLRIGGSSYRLILPSILCKTLLQYIYLELSRLMKCWIPISPSPSLNPTFPFPSIFPNSHNFIFPLPPHNNVKPVVPSRLHPRHHHAPIPHPMVQQLPTQGSRAGQEVEMRNPDGGNIVHGNFWGIVGEMLGGAGASSYGL